MDLRIRPFNGTLGDAQGVIEIDRETFADCHYTAEYVLALQADSRQRVWVAEGEARVLGFVSAFPTFSLAAGRWEVDELAVHPQAQGRGLGTALIAQAVAGADGSLGLVEARALVALNNAPSQRAFLKNGFASAARMHLLVYQIAGRMPRPTGPYRVQVRPATPQDAPAVAGLAGCAVSRAGELLGRTDNLYLVAERDRRVRGYAELIHVRTLQYEGFWIESLVAMEDEGHMTSALCRSAVEVAKRRASLDEVGYLISPRDRAPYTAAVREGFLKFDEYSVFVRELNRP